MSAETVTNKIEEKAKESALEILANAEKEGARIRDGIIADARQREEKILRCAVIGFVRKRIKPTANLLNTDNFIL